MQINVLETKVEMSRAAARKVAESLKSVIMEKGSAGLIVATGASQLDMLSCLVTEQGISWEKVTVFHLDEYIGLSDEHPASFRKYLKERFVEKLPNLKMFHYVNGDDDPHAECRRLSTLIRETPIDVACIGIGENGHLAFNDPPADFETEEPYIIVTLDEGCRNQQFGEGWFPTFEDVPETAISMSIKYIMKSACVVCTVPDERKAEAVRGAVEGTITNSVPASILQSHSDCHLFLDKPAASLLSK
ncbi:MAG: glucosamine-6-phosphate deaminase [Bacteroidetes bacterium]|nr:glucosamine-6-phosphate deaminase [Bacteroidota bacterium]